MDVPRGLCNFFLKVTMVMEQALFIQQRRVKLTTKLIRGTDTRKQILSQIAAEVKQIKKKPGSVPGLVTLIATLKVED